MYSGAWNEGTVCLSAAFTVADLLPAFHARDRKGLQFS